MTGPLVLGIESSCDETAVAVVRGDRTILAQRIASQNEAHERFGGVVPELASRMHLSALPLLLADFHTELSQAETIAVTRGPGLLPCLSMGVTLARSLALARGLPIVGVNHLRAHVHSPFIAVHAQNPAGFAAGDTNLARYVANSPVNLRDPSGLVVGGGFAVLGLFDAHFDRVAVKRGHHRHTVLHRSASRLVERDKVDVLIGTVHSGVQMGIHKVARDTGVLNLIPNAGVHIATRAQCAPNVFRTSFSNSQPTMALGEAMVKRGHKKAVWITWKYAAGDEAFEGFKESYTKAGGTIVKELGLPFPNVEFQALLTEIAALKPDAVACFFAGGGAAKFLKDYAAAGVTTLSIASYYDTLEKRMETVRLMPELLAQAGLAEA